MPRLSTRGCMMVVPHPPATVARGPPVDMECERVDGSTGGRFGLLIMGLEIAEAFGSVWIRFGAEKSRAIMESSGTDVCPSICVFHYSCLETAWLERVKESRKSIMCFLRGGAGITRVPYIPSTANI